MTAGPSAFHLDESLAAFVQQGGSINVGARDAANRPLVTRAVGCRVSADRSQVAVFVPCARSEELLERLRENRHIAVVFNRTTTHEAVQLKGNDARVGELEPGDAAVVAAYRRAFCDEVAELGYPVPLTEALLGDPAQAVMRVTFTPTSAFQQTPGPRAGRPMEARR